MILESPHTLAFMSFISEWFDIDFTFGLLGAFSIFFTVVAGLLMLVSFFGGGDLDGDAGVAGAEGGLFSTRTIIGFFLGLSWGAFVTRAMDMSIIVCLLVGTLCGLATFFVIGVTMRMLLRMHTDGSFKYESLEGMEGEVYLTIPPAGESGGQVQVAHPQQFITIAAMQEGDTAIPAHARVIITKASSTMVTVKAL